MGRVKTCLLRIDFHPLLQADTLHYRSSGGYVKKTVLNFIKSLYAQGYRHFVIYINKPSDVFKTQKNERGYKLEIKVTKIQIGTSLIAQKGNENAGEYVPTWYVDYEYRWDDSETIDNDWVTEQIMFRASDGTYIEPRIGDDTIQKFAEGE